MNKIKKSNIASPKQSDMNVKDYIEKIEEYIKLTERGKKYKILLRKQTEMIQKAEKIKESVDAEIEKMKQEDLIQEELLNTLTKQVESLATNHPNKAKLKEVILHLQKDLELKKQFLEE